MNTHQIQALIVAVLTIAGWSALTCFAVRHTHGRRERRFVIRASIVSFLCIIAVATLEHFFIRGYLSGFGVIMALGFLLLRRRQLAIRREETTNA